MAVPFKLTFRYGIQYVPLGKRRVEVAAAEACHEVSIRNVDLAEVLLAYRIRHSQEYYAYDAICRVYLWDGSFWATKVPVKGLQQLVLSPGTWEKEWLRPRQPGSHHWYSSASDFHPFYTRPWSYNPELAVVQFETDSFATPLDTVDQARQAHPSVRKWDDDGGEKARRLIDERVKDLIIVGEDLCVRISEPCFRLGWDRNEGDIPMWIAESEWATTYFSRAWFDYGTVLRWSPADLAGARLAAKMLAESATGGDSGGRMIFDRIADLPSHDSMYSAIETSKGIFPRISGTVDAFRSAARLCRELPEVGRTMEFNDLEKYADDPFLSLGNVVAAKVVVGLDPRTPVNPDRRRDWSNQSDAYRSFSLKNMIVALCKVGLWGLEREAEDFWPERAFQLPPKVGEGIQVIDIISRCDLQKVADAAGISDEDIAKMNQGSHFLGAWLADGSLSAVAVTDDAGTVLKIIGIDGRAPAPATVSRINEVLSGGEYGNVRHEDVEAFDCL